jgi:hypothetical protein
MDKARPRNRPLDPVAFPGGILPGEGSRQTAGSRIRQPGIVRLNFRGRPEKFLKIVLPYNHRKVTAKRINIVN